MVFEFIFAALANSRLLHWQSVVIAFNHVQQRRTGAVPASPDVAGGEAGKGDLVSFACYGVGDEETGKAWFHGVR